MKTLISTLIATTLLISNISMASASIELENEYGAAKPTLTQDQMDKADKKPKKDKRKDKHRKKYEEKMSKLSPQEKEEFFNKKIEKMEKRISKVKDDKRKVDMEKDLTHFKTLSITEKEIWLKENHKKMKRGKKHFKKMCDKLKNDPDMKMLSDEEFLQKVKSSERFKSASPEEKEKMMKKFNKMKSKSPEEKEKMFKKRKAHLKEKCASMDKKKHK